MIPRGRISNYQPDPSEWVLSQHITEPRRAWWEREAPAPTPEPESTDDTETDQPA